MKTPVIKILVVILVLLPHLLEANQLNSHVHRVINILDHLNKPFLNECSDHNKLSKLISDSEVYRFDQASAIYDDRPVCPLNALWFCDTVSDACSRHYGTKNCYASNSDVEERFSSEELRKKVTEFTVKRFHELRQDSELQEACCGDNWLCRRKWFARTEFKILKGLPANDYTAYYRPKENVVEISESLLVRTYNKEGIDFVLLHELGHSCQFAIARTTGKYSRLAWDCTDWKLQNKQPEPVGFSHLPEGVGECVANAVSEGSDHSGGHCLSHRQGEAFAEAIFAFRKGSVFHWAQTCNSGESKAHPLLIDYLGCLLKEPRVTQLFCEGKSR